MACRSMCAIRMETKLSCMASDQMPNQAMQSTATARVRNPSIAIVGSFSSWSPVSVLVRKSHPLQFERSRQQSLSLQTCKSKEMINGGDFKAAAELRPRWLGRGEFQFGPLPPGY